MNLRTEIQPLGVALPGEHPNDLMRREGAAEYLRRRYCIGSRQHLVNLAHKSEGPAYRMIGGIAIYRRGDLDAWVVARTSRFIDPEGTAERRSPASSTIPASHFPAPVGEPEHAASAA